MKDKQVAIKVFDEHDMVDKDYADIYIGDDEPYHWYMYREPEPNSPNSKDIWEGPPE